MERAFSQCGCCKREVWNQSAYGHPKDNENKVYQVLEVDDMNQMQEAMKDPEIAKARTDAGVDLNTQEIVFLVEQNKIAWY